VKVLRRHNPLRMDWLNASDEGGAVGVSLLAHRSEIIVDVEVNGVREERYVSLRWLAEVLAEAVHEADVLDAAACAELAAINADVGGSR